MKNGWRRLAPEFPAGANRVIEPAFALLNVGALIYSLWHMIYVGYLPQPFFYDPQDLWGDWFNVAYWAYDKGTYDYWGSLYPPLSFVFLRVFTLARCYPPSAGDGSAGLPARECDWLGVTTPHLIYILNVVLVAWIFYKQDRKTAVWRGLGLMCGMQMLEAFEHANLVMITFTCVILGYGPLLKSARMRWLFVGLAINFKIYLISSIFPALLQRRWLWFEAALISVLGIYFVTFAILGRGFLPEIIANVGVYSSGQASRLLDVWFAATYLPLESLLDNWQGPVGGLIGSKNVELGLMIIRTAMWSTRLAIVLAAAAVWLMPESVTRHRITLLAISMALISSEGGGYTPIFIVFFAFLEPWRGLGAKVAIVSCYILAIPLDIPIQKATTLTQNTFLPSHTIALTYWVTVGPFVRPMFVLMIPFALSCATLRAVWVDMQNDGWRSRWRYRNDLPLLFRWPQWIVARDEAARGR